MNDDKFRLLKEKTILFIDDDVETSELMVGILKKISKEVFVAFNGKEGVQKCSEVNPDIIVTDIEMPIMNGLEMIDIIREKNKLPIIVISAYNDKKHISSKASATLFKPIDIKILKEALTSVI